MFYNMDLKLQSKMACLSDGEENAIKTFQTPSHLEVEVSPLCLKQFKGEKVIVGHEKGAYIKSIDDCGSQEIVKRLDSEDDAEVASICIDVNNRDVFYATSESKIFKFDYRCPLDKEVGCFTENRDEINSLEQNENGLLASCDDSGECKIYDTKKDTLYRTLRNRHKNICSAGSFLKTRTDIIVTGGLDSQLIAWNFVNVRPLQTISTQDLLQKLGDNSVAMFNPPMVHTISSSSDGKLMASGLGMLIIYVQLLNNKFFLEIYTLLIFTIIWW